MTTPYVILAAGQSNIEMTPSHVWTPAANAKKWNNIPADELSYGSAFNALSGSNVGVAESYASRVAAADPTKDVYLIKSAKSGMDITHWIGGAFYDINTGYPGKVSWNTGSHVSATELYISTIDNLGIRRPYSTALIQAGDVVQLRQGEITWTYVATGSPTYYGETTWATIPVYYYIGHSSTPVGTVQVAIKPQYVPHVSTTVATALAAIGASKVNLFLWWQGESDAQFNTRYELEFNSFASWLGGQPWWAVDTKSIFCGHCPTELNGLAQSSPFNSRMAAIASTYSGYYANLAALPASVWQGYYVGWATDPFHMSAAGYKAAGDYIYDNVYAPALNSRLKVRTADNTGWTTLNPSQVKIRNAANTGWIPATASSIKIRNATDTGWISAW